MSTFGQIGAMLSRSGGKDRDINDMPERIKNMEGFIIKMREWLEPQDDAAILHWIEFADGLAQGYETKMHHILQEITNALSCVRTNFGAEVFQKSLRTCVLPNEVVNAAICCHAGITEDTVKDFARRGLLTSNTFPGEMWDAESTTLIDLNGGYFLLNEDMPSARVETVVKRLSVQAEEEGRPLSELLEDSSQSKLRFKKITDPELMNAYLKAFRTSKIIGTLITAEAGQITVTRCQNMLSQDDTAELDHRASVRKSLDDEYDDLKTAYMSDAEKAFNNAYEISVKTEFYCALNGNIEFDDKVYKALYNDRGIILQKLFNIFLDMPNASVNSNAETEEFIEYYCEQYYPEIMDEEEEPYLQ